MTETRLGGRAATVLIADDEEEIREVLRQILEDQGYRVVEARDGAEALAVTGREEVDLIVLDLVMPEREGIETLQMLVQSERKMKVLAISGAFSGMMLRAARNLGADEVLKKPFSCEAILGKVEELLGGVGRS